jgi:endonuclease-3
MIGFQTHPSIEQQFRNLGARFIGQTQMSSRHQLGNDPVYNAVMVRDSDKRSTVESRASEMLRRLEQNYGRPVWRVDHPPLDELVMTILSQHTSDANCERAFASLRNSFLSWQNVADADVDLIAEAIRSGGLAAMKAPRIKSVVREALATGLLDDLDSLSLSEAKQRLQSLSGVGPKTAACVLLFACKMPALPVDTHVHRVSKRVGLIDQRLSAERAHDELESMLCPEDVYSFHVNVIHHGRTVCKARAPRCGWCSLADICDFARCQLDVNGEPVGLDVNH